jgi:hypothetical protein
MSETHAGRQRIFIPTQISFQAAHEHVKREKVVVLRIIVSDLKGFK